MLSAGEKNSGATCPSRAVPRNAFTAEEAAQVDEITRLTAEPLMVRAQNGGGVVWQSKLCLLPLLWHIAFSSCCSVDWPTTDWLKMAVHGQLSTLTGTQL